MGFSGQQKRSIFEAILSVICVHSKYIMYLDLFFFCILFSFVFAVLQFIFSFSPQFCRSGRSMFFFQKNSQCCLVDNATAGVGGLLRPILMTLSICQEAGTCKKVGGDHLSLLSAVTLRLRTGYFHFHNCFVLVSAVFVYIFLVPVFILISFLYCSLKVAFFSE